MCDSFSRKLYFLVFTSSFLFLVGEGLTAHININSFRKTYYLKQSPLLASSLNKTNKKKNKKKTYITDDHPGRPCSFQALKNFWFRRIITSKNWPILICLAYLLSEAPIDKRFFFFFFSISHNTQVPFRK